MLVAAPENAAGAGWVDLIGRHLLLTGNHPIYWDPLLVAVSRRQPHLRTLAVDRVDVTKRLLEEGLGVSFLPLSSVVRELAEGRLVTVPVDMELPTAATYLILPQHREVPERPGVRAAVEAVIPRRRCPRAAGAVTGSPGDRDEHGRDGSARVPADPSASRPANGP